MLTRLSSLRRLPTHPHPHRWCPHWQAPFPRPSRLYPPRRALLLPRVIQGAFRTPLSMLPHVHNLMHVRRSPPRCRTPRLVPSRHQSALVQVLANMNHPSPILSSCQCPSLAPRTSAHRSIFRSRLLNSLYLTHHLRGGQRLTLTRQRQPSRHSRSMSTARKMWRWRMHSRRSTSMRSGVKVCSGLL